MTTDIKLMGYNGQLFGKGDVVEVCSTSHYWKQGIRRGVCLETSLKPDERVKVKMVNLPGIILVESEDTFKKVG